MAELRLALLGPPNVELDGRPVTFDTRKAVALLALLAVDGRARSRDELAALFWPDADEGRAKAALRRTLSVTGAGVGDALQAGRDTVALAAGATRIDVAEFRSLTEQDDLDALAQGAALYRGDFLSGFSVRGAPEFDDWQLFTAESLRLQLGATLARLVELRSRQGRFDAAIDDARRWLALDTLSEPAHQALIRLYAWTGRRPLAIKQYRSCVRILDRELRVAPLRETTELYRDVLADRLDPPPEPALVGAPTSSGSAPPGDGTARAERPDADPLVGREEELGVLRRVWGTLEDGGALVGICGEEGTGKSSLIEAISAECAAGGAAAMVVRCHQGERAMAYAVAVEIVRAAVSARPEAVAALELAERAELARLVPSIASSGALPPMVEGSAARTRFFAAVTSAVASVLGPSGGAPPGVLAIDGAQWADAPSLELIGFMARRAPELRGLLLVTWAPEVPPEPGLRALTDLIGSEGRALVSLADWDRDGVKALLEATGTEADPDWLLAETHGLPLLVAEYAQAIRSRRLDPYAVSEPPSSVRRLLEAKVADADEITLQTVSALAVLGRGSGLDLLRAVSGRSEAETVAAVEDAVRRRLLVEHPGGGRAAGATYDFPYAGLARICYQRMTLARRRLLHSRAADALAHLGVPTGAGAPEVVGRHLQEAGRDEEAAGWWWRAAERSRSLWAHEEALAQLQSARALGYSDQLVSAAIGDALTMLGRYGEAITEYERAAGHEPGENDLALLEHRLAEVHHRLGDYASAEAHLAIALDQLSSVSAQRAVVESDLALVAYRRGDPGRALEHAERALSRAKLDGQGPALAQSLNVVGMLAADTGDVVTAEGHLRAAVEHARVLDDPVSLGAALNNLARLLERTGRRSEALVAQREALAAGERSGDRHRTAALHTNLADLLHREGEEDGAMEHLKVAARLFATVDAGAHRPEIWTLVTW